MHLRVKLNVCQFAAVFCSGVSGAMNMQMALWEPDERTMLLRWLIVLIYGIGFSLMLMVTSKTTNKYNLNTRRRCAMVGGMIVMACAAVSYYLAI